MFAKLSVGFAVAAMAVSIATTADAHAHLVSAVPAAGGMVNGSPPALRINFSEEVFAKFSGVEIKDAAGKAVAVGKSTVDAADGRIMTVPLKRKLAPGAYNVIWHAVSEDTHRSTGKYSFTVQ